MTNAKYATVRLWPRWCCLSFSPSALAQLWTKGSEDLAKRLANPIAALLIVPIQKSYDERFGAAKRWTKVQLRGVGREK